MRRLLPIPLVLLALLAGCKDTTAPAAGGGEPALVGSGAGVAPAGGPSASAQPVADAGATASPGVSAPAASSAPIPAGRPQLVRTAVPIAHWQTEFDRIVAAKYRLVHADGYEVGGKTFVNGIFRPADGVAWVARHNLTAAGYQTAFDQFKAQGYRLADVSTYLVSGQIRYAAIWRKASGPAWTAYHGMSQSDHQSKLEALTAQGYHPIAISVAAPGDKPQWSALYVKESVGTWLAKSWLTLAEYQQQWDAATAQGMRVAYLSATQYAGSVRISVIFQAGSGAYEARFGLTAAEVATKSAAHESAGRLVRGIAGYVAGGSARFALAWS